MNDTNFEVVEISDPLDIWRLLIDNDVRLWVVVFIDPIFDNEFYTENAVVNIDGEKKSANVMTFYATRPFSGDQKDIEKLVSIAMIYLPIVTFSDLRVKNVARIPSPLKHNRVINRSPDNYIKIFDPDNGIVYIINKKIYRSFINGLDKYHLRVLIDKYPDTMESGFGGTMPKWMRKLME